MKSNSWNSSDFDKAACLSLKTLQEFKTTLIVAPHPDDEALGCGGLISLLTALNQPVYVVFVTHGGASHPHSTTHLKIKLIALREQEALKSCEILGVKTENSSFFRAEDGGLSNLKATKKSLLEEKFRHLFIDKKIDTVFLPWRRDPHQDHIATYQLAEKAVFISEKPIKIVEYPIWLYKNSQKNDWPLKEEVDIFKLDIQQQNRIKKRAIFAHQSQTSILIKDDPKGFILTEDLLAPFMKDFEIYFFGKHGGDLS